MRSGHSSFFHSIPVFLSSPSYPRQRPHTAIINDGCRFYKNELFRRTRPGSAASDHKSLWEMMYIVQKNALKTFSKKGKMILTSLSKHYKIFIKKGRRRKANGWPCMCVKEATLPWSGRLLFWCSFILPLPDQLYDLYDCTDRRNNQAGKLQDVVKHLRTAFRMYFSSHHPLILQGLSNESFHNQGQPLTRFWRTPFRYQHIIFPASLQSFSMLYIFFYSSFRFFCSA